MSPPADQEILPSPELQRIHHRVHLESVLLSLSADDAIAMWPTVVRDRNMDIIRQYP
jgi:hypothetical protein